MHEEGWRLDTIVVHTVAENRESRLWGVRVDAFSIHSHTAGAFRKTLSAITIFFKSPCDRGAESKNTLCPCLLIIILLAREEFSPLFKTYSRYSADEEWCS